MSINREIEEATADMDAAQERYSEHRHSDPDAAKQDADDFYAAKHRLRALEAEADGH